MNDISKIETQFKDKIKGFLNQNSFNTWIKPIKIVNIDNDIISFQVPSKVHIDYIKGQYKSVFEKTLVEILGKESPSIKFLIDSETDFNLDQKSVFEKTEKKSRDIPKSRFAPYKETSLNPKYTFENFVMGNGNETAYASSMQVANNIKKTQYNPLLIFGGVGLGKTHLVSAIGNHVFNSDPGLKIIYLTSDLFVFQIVNHIKNKTIDDYKNYLSSKDLIIIDDIQFFAKKEKSQEELFHIFNHIYYSGGQIVLTSDFHPNEIHELDDRLKSRFKMGLITDVRPPDLETRAAIIRLKAEEINSTLDDDIVMFIANNINTNVRDLEGAVKKLYFYYSHFNKEITINKAKEILKELITSKKSTLNIDKIQDIVSEFFSIPKDLLMKKNRTKEIADARAVAMYLCTTQLKATTTSIGVHFGGREHSTVSHAANKIQKKLTVKDPETVKMIEEILNVINLSTC
ncbi:MAG: chromosomal replication initiator protein DnaA [Candidatus Delongbacteria bacterium]|nr:chromosomal replication initiator protein DnaA [Candidatus Delongbacteria bacterium]MCG2761395.1 chromosomal replication initiator protein DnaA [Candidatus Delongbacteria bacterium]